MDVFGPLRHYAFLFGFCSFPHWSVFNTARVSVLKFGREDVTDLAVKKLRGCETLAAACEHERLSGVDSALDDECRGVDYDVLGYKTLGRPWLRWLPRDSDAEICPV